MIYSTKINSLPFDLENPLGYSFAVILESVLALKLLHYEACFLSMALTALLLANLSNGLIKDGLQSINRMAKNKKTESDIIGPFSRMVRTNAETKQLSKNRFIGVC